MDASGEREGDAMMTKQEFTQWVAGQYEALNLTDAERATCRAQIIKIISTTHGGTFGDYKYSVRECVFRPIREARAAAEAARVAEIKARAFDVARSMERTPAVIAAEDERIEAAVRAWEATIARRERRAGRLAA